MINQLKRSVLTWPEWCRKPENKKLVKENIHKAKLKYKNDLSLAEQYNKYMLLMMGLVSTPAAAQSGGSPALYGIGNYMIGKSGQREQQFIVH
tara:strand:+ start:55 stop:333 length:279 start_codon:yes stop_codon:yes gene_type:complete